MNYITQGGPIMVLLVLISVLAIAIIINRIRFYAKCSQKKGGDFIKEIMKYLSADSPESAVSLCEKTPGPVAAVVKSGLEVYREGAMVMEEAFQSRELKEIPRLEKFLPILSTIAAVSTLTGFTGTVTGMIKAFNNIAKAGASSPAIVASGISQALLTTAAGLLIAIPVVIFLRYFESTVDRFVNEIDLATHEVIRISRVKNSAQGARL